MKIAITGHTKGIGKAFSNILKIRGHEIIGISKSEGKDINNVIEISNIIEPCDMFINNAHSNYAQIDLFYEVWKKWKGLKKHIWNIGSYNPFNLNNENNRDDLEYVMQKQFLNKVTKVLNSKSMWPMVTLLNPGHISIKNENIIKNMEEYYSSEELKPLLNIKLKDEKFMYGHTPEQWVKCIIDVFDNNNNAHISEISLSYNDPINKIKI